MSALYDPRLAVWLYTALIVTTLMFSKRWADVRSAISKGVSGG